MDEGKLEKSLKFIDSWLDSRYRRNEWPGFVVAISLRGKIIFNKAYGFADLEKKEKLTPQHIFRIASHSKTFTATVIMQLADKGKIKLDDHIVEYLPWLKKHKDKRFKKITIKQLLSHSAGIIRDGLDCDFWELRKSFPEKEQLKKEILKSELIFDSNTKLKYSNIGYSILGLIIENVSGKSYEEYVIKNIIEPLNLKNTGPEFSKQIEKKLVMGYSRRDKDKKRLPIASKIDTRSMASATGFYSTSEDLCNYFNAQMIGSGKLISDKSKQKMQQPIWKIKNNEFKKEYGLGFMIMPAGKRKMVGHGGGFPGQTTISMFDPKDQLFVTVLVNCIDFDPDHTLKGIVSIIDYFQKNYRSSENNLSKFEGRLMELWSIVDIVSMGNKLVSVYPDAWDPFSAPEILRYVDNNTLKVVKTDGLYSEGELIHYKFDEKGKIKFVVYAGATMLPEEKYLSKIENLSIIKTK